MIAITRLSGVIPTFLTMLQPRSPLVLHGAGGEPATKLKMSLVKDPGAAARLSRMRAGRKGKHLVGHDGGWLPFPRRDAGIQMSKT